MYKKSIFLGGFYFGRVFAKNKNRAIHYISETSSEDAIPIAHATYLPTTTPTQYYRVVNQKQVLYFLKVFGHYRLLKNLQ